MSSHSAIGWPRLAALAVTLLAGVSVNAQDQSRDDRWREDVRFLARTLPTSHKNAFAYVSEAKFAQAVKELDAAIPALSDNQLRLRVARIAALVQDVHTSAPLPTYSLRLPFTVYWFENGPTIVNATDDHKALIGARITKVNGRDIRTVADTLRPYLSTENELGFWSRAGQLLLRPQALRDVGLGGDSSTATFELSKDGRTTTVAVQAVPSLGFTLPVREVPLHRQQPGVKYWWTYLPNERTVFVKYNQCRDPADFRRMTDSITAVIDAERPLRVVVDLRDNGGGNSLVVWPMLQAIRSRSAINAPDALYVLIGRGTLSSGLFAAADFKKQTNATLLGEPTGERPNHYGEQLRFKLPNSGIEVTYSTKFHVLVERQADAYTPDILAPPTPDAFLRGIDPAMEWILKNSRRAGPS